MESTHWMKEALALAESAAKLGEVPIGAILVHDNKIIGEGFNKRENSRRTCAHAEIIAIEDFNKKANAWRLPPETHLFVTAEPCLMCAGALMNARLSHLHFGCVDPKNAGIRSILPLHDEGRFDHRLESIESGVLENECAQILKRFFNERRKGQHPSFSGND